MRIGMKHWYLYIPFTFAISFAFSFGLFMLNREELMVQKEAWVDAFHIYGVARIPKVSTLFHVSDVDTCIINLVNAGLLTYIFPRDALYHSVELAVDSQDPVLQSKSSDSFGFLFGILERLDVMMTSEQAKPWPNRGFCSPWTDKLHIELSVLVREGQVHRLHNHVMKGPSSLSLSQRKRRVHRPVESVQGRRCPLGLIGPSQMRINIINWCKSIT